MHPTLRILKDLDKNPRRCKCLIEGKFCTKIISEEAYKAASTILDLRVFTNLDLGYYYEDDLRELARLSFCEDCAEDHRDQYEEYYKKLSKWMGKELDNLPVPEKITISKPEVHISSGEADSDGYTVRLADKAKDNQGVNWSERVKNLEAEKDELNKQISDLKHQLEQQYEIAQHYLEKANDLYKAHVQLKREYAMEMSQRNARELALLMRIDELEQHTPQVQQDTQVPRMANVDELLQVSDTLKALHDKLSWLLGSRPEGDDEEEEL